MFAHRLVAEAQRLGGLLVAAAEGEQVQHLPLPMTQHRRDKAHLIRRCDVFEVMDRQLRRLVQAQLALQVLAMPARGAEAQAQLLGDLAISAAAGDQRQYLSFTRCEHIPAPYS